MTDTSTTILRRLYPGSQLENTFDWPFETLDNLDSFLIKDCNDIKYIVELPDSVDKQVWQYEHLRQVCLELNLLVVALEHKCTKEICPEMKADGWLYLCAAHPSTQTCPAIDYIIHTLDGATNLLNNSKYFPSRISIPEPSLKHFQSIARRLYRIFAHAYFHHREIYEFYENETSLYSRFLLLSRTYNLVPPELISIPDNEEEEDDDDGQDENNEKNNEKKDIEEDNQSQVTAIEVE
ncbi:unnamed protein product [Cunninghamella echinulata]